MFDNLERNRPSPLRLNDLASPEPPRPAQPPLPPGWEARRDRKGRVYYVDHNMRVAQWSPPQAVALIVQPISLATRADSEVEHKADSPHAAGRLPNGWEAKVDVRGRTFYVDHNTRTTHWDLPGARSERQSTGGSLSTRSFRSHLTNDGQDMYTEEGENESQWTQSEASGTAMSTGTGTTTTAMGLGTATKLGLMDDPEGDGGEDEEEDGEDGGGSCDTGRDSRNISDYNSQHWRSQASGSLAPSAYSDASHWTERRQSIQSQTFPDSQPLSSVRESGGHRWPPRVPVVHDMDMTLLAGSLRDPAYNANTVLPRTPLPRVAGGGQLSPLEHMYAPQTPGALVSVPPDFGGSPPVLGEAFALALRDTPLQPAAAVLHKTEQPLRAPLVGALEGPGLVMMRAVGGRRDVPQHGALQPLSPLEALDTPGPARSPPWRDSLEPVLQSPVRDHHEGDRGGEGALGGAEGLPRFLRPFRGRGVPPVQPDSAAVAQGKLVGGVAAGRTPRRWAFDSQTGPTGASPLPPPVGGAQPVRGSITLDLPPGGGIAQDSPQSCMYHSAQEDSPGSINTPGGGRKDSTASWALGPTPRIQEMSVSSREDSHTTRPSSSSGASPARTAPAMMSAPVVVQTQPAHPEDVTSPGSQAWSSIHSVPSQAGSPHNNNSSPSTEWALSQPLSLRNEAMLTFAQGARAAGGESVGAGQSGAHTGRAEVEEAPSYTEQDGDAVPSPANALPPPRPLSRSGSWASGSGLGRTRASRVVPGRVRSRSPEAQQATREAGQAGGPPTVSLGTPPPPVATPPTIALPPPVPQQAAPRPPTSEFGSARYTQGSMQSHDFPMAASLIGGIGHAPERGQAGMLQITGPISLLPGATISAVTAGPSQPGHTVHPATWVHAALPKDRADDAMQDQLDVTEGSFISAGSSKWEDAPAGQDSIVDSPQSQAAGSWGAEGCWTEPPLLTKGHVTYAEPLTQSQLEPLRAPAWNSDSPLSPQGKGMATSLDDTVAASAASYGLEGFGFGSGSSGSSLRHAAWEGAASRDGSSDGGMLLRKSPKHILYPEIKRVQQQGTRRHRPIMGEAWMWWWNLRPRYVEQGNPPQRIKLDKGEHDPKARHFEVWKTKWWQLSGFGLGVGMYFTVLVLLTAVMAMYALINSYAIWYFGSAAYSHGQSGLRSDLRGSAVCTNPSRVVAYMADGLAAGPQLRNDCPLSLGLGLADVVGVGLLFGFIFLLGSFQNKVAEETAAQETSASQYTVQVMDPDPQAADPDRWREFFSQFGHVTYVTVARANGALISAMGQRRKCYDEIENSTLDAAAVIAAYKAVDGPRTTRDISQASGATLLPRWQRAVQPLGFHRDLLYWQQRLWDAQAKVDKAVTTGLNAGYPVARVYVTFETAAARRKCLQWMDSGIIPRALNCRGEIADRYKFVDPYGRRATLTVAAAPPPEEIYYETQEVSWRKFLLAQLLSCLVAGACVMVGFAIIYAVYDVGSGALAAIAVALMNAALPPLVKFATALERHSSQGSRQLSLLDKLVLARWFNAAVIIFLLSNYEDTLSSHNLSVVANVLWADAVTTPLLRLLDLEGKLSHYVLAPTAQTQEKMNSYFLGSHWQLTERYTDMTKTLFLALFFAPIFPAGLWIACFGLFLSYWTDKYCLFRVWREPPPVDARLMGQVRKHMACAVLVHCVSALYYYSGWPFDNVCRFYGGWIVCSQRPTAVTQDNTFGWMTGEQKSLVTMFSTLVITWSVLLLLYYYGWWLLQRGAHLFMGTQAPSAKGDQRRPYSTLKTEHGIIVEAYVPRVHIPGMAQSLLACDTAGLAYDDLPWQVDDGKGGLYQALSLCSWRDLPHLRDAERAKLFSVCQHYPPPQGYDAVSAEYRTDGLQVQGSRLLKWATELRLAARDRRMPEWRAVSSAHSLSTYRIGVHQEESPAPDDWGRVMEAPAMQPLSGFASTSNPLSATGSGRGSAGGVGV